MRGEPNVERVSGKAHGQALTEAGLNAFDDGIRSANLAAFLRCARKNPLLPFDRLERQESTQTVIRGREGEQQCDDSHCLPASQADKQCVGTVVQNDSAQKGLLG